MKLPRFTIRDLFWLVLVAAMGLGWWLFTRRAAEDRRRSSAEVAALRRAKEMNDALLRSGFSSRPYVPMGIIPETPEEFIRSLREIEDWYKFADDTADPFARTPAAAQAIPALIELLSDPDEEVRTRAACSLGKNQAASRFRRASVDPGAR